jgi:hypothetical protein
VAPAAARDALKAMIDVQAERVVAVQDPEGAFAVRRTASKDNPEALQGFHAEHLLFLIDEASGIPDVVFRGRRGRALDGGALSPACPRPPWAGIKNDFRGHIGRRLPRLLK